MASEGDELLMNNSKEMKASEFELEIQECCENIYAQVLAKVKLPRKEEAVEEFKWSGCNNSLEEMIDQSTSNIHAKFMVKVKDRQMKKVVEDHNSITPPSAQSEVTTDDKSNPQSSTRQTIEQNCTSRQPLCSSNQQHGGGYGPFGPQRGGPTTGAPPYGYQQPFHHPIPPQQYQQQPSHPIPPERYQQQPSHAYDQFSQQPASSYSSGWEHCSLASTAWTQQQISSDCYWQQSRQDHQTSHGTVGPTEVSGYGYNEQLSYFQPPVQTPLYDDLFATYGQSSYPQ